MVADYTFLARLTCLLLTGLTPLHIACDMHRKSSADSVKGSRMRTVRHLLNAHADPGIVSKTGNAVHHALWGSLQDAMQVL